MTDTSAASLFGCAQLTDQHPSMLLPLFKFPTEETLYAQVYDPFGYVRALHPIGETPWWVPQEDQVINVEKDDEPIISFTDSDGSIYCGKRSDLLQKLRTICGSQAASESFKLSAYELIGDRDKAIHHRSKSIEIVAKELGVASAYAYKNSVAVDLTWRLLEKHTVSTDALDKFLLFRATVTSHFRDDALEINLGSMSANDFAISIDDITRIISDEMKGLETFSQTPPKADLSNMGGTDPAYKDIMQAVASSNRQEERISILIRSILLSPRQGIHFLEHYPHRAQFELEAVNIIREAIGPWDSVDQLEIEFRLSLIIGRLIRASYPMRKGETIFFFAEHLSDFDLLRSQIEKVFRSSNSVSVNLLSKQIDGALSRRNSQIV